jgi:hypothetical protein
MKNRSALLILFGILMCGALHAQPPSYVPTDGLQLWYDFNDPIDDFDPSSLNIATTPNCLPGIDRFGDANGSALFTQFNSNVFVNIPSFTTPFVSGDLGLSINLWYTADFEEESGVLAQCFDYDGPNGGWKIEWQKTPENTTEISASYRNFTTDSCSTVVTIPEYDFAWHMTTVVIDGTGITVYIDGASLGTGSWVTGLSLIQLAFTDPLYIGNRPTPQSLATAFNGRIDDFGLWSRALTQQEITDLNSVPATSGCTNSNACNYYEELGLTDNDGSCAYTCLGCMLPYACNYDQNATINNPDSCDLSCIADTITVFAFNDMNANNVFDEGDGALEQWPLSVVAQDSMVVYSNYDGYFYGGPYEGIALPPGEFTVRIEFDPTSWVASLPAEQPLTIPSEDDTLFFAIRPATTAPAATVNVLHGYWDEVHCETGYGAGIYVENTGGTIINGVLRMFCDDIFETGPDSSFNVEPDSTGFGAARWTIEDLYPGTSRYYTFHVLEDFGSIESFDFEYQVQLESGGTEFYANSFSETIPTACDPSPAGEVLASPAGVFSPQNFILNEDQIEYRVQFRNEGPGPSEALSIAINLNSQQVDINTFNVVATSLDLRTCLHDDGSIDFFAPSYIIPDTAQDPIGSNQFIVFTVDLNPSLAAGDSINVNPIIHLISADTNTIRTSYVHHIFDCNSFVGPEGFSNSTNPVYDETTGTLVQLNEANSPEFNLDFSAQNPFAEYYIWSIDGSDADTTNSLIINAEILNNTGQPFVIELTIGNSLCEEVMEFPLLIGLDELGEDARMMVYPNPFSDNCTVVFPDFDYSMSLVDVAGRIVKQWSNCPKTLAIERENLQSGYYRLIASNRENRFSVPLVIE